MARRISSSQFRSKIRQLQSKQRQQVQKLKSAVNRYNSAVRTYNTKVRQNNSKIRSALSRIRRPSTTTRFTMVRTSAIALHETYARLEQNTRYAEDDPRYRLAVELPQQESINSLRVAEALTTDEPLEDEAEENLQDSAISEALRQISPDLHDRWHGALFALSPKNPDAARHFCSSAREIFTQVLQMKAPDDDVASALPDHQKDQRGKPTRRSRIHFLLHQRGMTDSTLEEFVEQDISNVIELFDVLNKGTHGAAGAFDLRTLLSIKTRVEQALGFVTELATSS